MAIAVVAASLAGCGGSPTSGNNTTNLGAMSQVGTDPNATALNKPGENGSKISTQPPVTNRKPNEKGMLLVPMFHHLGNSKDPVFCTPTEFVGWLDEMDKMGMRPVTASQYLSNKMNLPVGATPVVITFDDGNPDQLQLDNNGNVTPDCFVGLWMKFAKDHPEFPVHATFFVLPVFFGQPKLQKKKLDLLLSLGCEIANHTITHPNLSHLNDLQVESEIGQAQLRLEGMGIPTPIPLALPYGIRPRNHKLLEGFTYKEKSIKPSGVFMVGAGPAPSASSANFNPYHIPRVAGSPEPFGLTYWLDRIKEHKVPLYVQGPTAKS